MSKGKSIFLSILAVLCLIAVVTGVTVSYFLSKKSDKTTVGGEAYKFDVSISVNAIKTSSALVPVSDSLIKTAIEKEDGKCTSKEGYDICSLYEITLTNAGNLELLSGYLETVNSTYITSNLKYQLFDVSNDEVSSAASITNTNNAKNMFKKSNTNATISLDKGSSKYYLVIWLSDIGDNQPNDQNKVFTGRITFESINGPKITSTFITP